MLPVVFNTQRIFANEIIGKFFDSRPSALGFTFKRGFSPSDDASVRCDFHETHPTTWVELFNRSNFHFSNCILLECLHFIFGQVFDAFRLSLGMLMFLFSFKHHPETVACNNGAGGSTERHFITETHLTEPQGKLKTCLHNPMFFL